MTRSGCSDDSGKCGTVRFIDSMLPASWPDRVATLAAAVRLDAHHEGDAVDLLLGAYDRWRRLGELPPEGPLLDLIAVVVCLLQGVAHEMRRRPRTPMVDDRATKMLSRHHCLDGHRGNDG